MTQTTEEATRTDLVGDEREKHVYRSPREEIAKCVALSNSRNDWQGPFLQAVREARVPLSVWILWVKTSRNTASKVLLGGNVKFTEEQEQAARSMTAVINYAVQIGLLPCNDTQVTLYALRQTIVSMANEHKVSVLQQQVSQLTAQLQGLQTPA